MVQLTDKHFAIQMPEEAESCELRGAYPGRPYPLLSFYGQGEAVKLPAGNYEIVVFNTKGCMEEDARKVVKNVGVWFDLFPNYEDDELPVDTGVESLQSLLRSKGCDVNKNYSIIQKQ